MKLSAAKAKIFKVKPPQRNYPCGGHDLAHTNTTLLIINESREKIFYSCDRCCFAVGSG